MFASYKKTFIYATIFLFVGLYGISFVSAQATSPVKFAFIDLNEIFDKCDKFKTAFSDLKKIYSDSKQALDDTGKELQDKFSQYNLQKEFMSEEAAKQRRTQLLKDREDFMQKTQTEEQGFKEAQNKKLQPLLEELQKVVEQIAKDDGYAFVFRRKYIVFGNEKFNITEKVIAQMNKK